VVVLVVVVRLWILERLRFLSKIKIERGWEERGKNSNYDNWPQLFRRVAANE